MIKRKQRIPMRDLATMATEDRETVEKNAMNGQVFNIFQVLAHHPKLVKRWSRLPVTCSASRPAVPRPRAPDPAHRLAEPGRVRIRPARTDRQGRAGVTEADVENIKKGPRGPGASTRRR